MNEVEVVLKRFGLSENEAKVYLAALKNEESSPYTISKQTGIPRTTVYEIVTSLALKDLVELEKSDGLMKQQTKIRAKNPSELRSILQKKRKELTLLEADIVSILPQLKGDYHKDKAYADFAFYPGIDGAKKVYLFDRVDNVDLPSVTWDYQFPMDAFGRELVDTDVEKGLTFLRNAKYRPKELFPLTDWSRHVMSYQYGRNPDYIKYTEFRYIDNPVWILKQRIIIKGERVRIICVEDGETWGLIIRSPSLARSMESMFYLQWQTAIPLTEEIVKSWGGNKFFAEEKFRKRTIK